MENLKLVSRYLKILSSYYLGSPLYKPDMVAVVISDSCNLKCRMCDFWQNPQRRKRKLGLDDYCQLFQELANYGVRKIQFTGGEPLLGSDFFEILAETKRRNLKTIVVTNGTLINAHNAEALHKNSDKIFVSLDGPTAEIHDDLRGIQGTFERVIEGIRLLNSLKTKTSSPTIAITSIITPYNIHQPQDMLALADDLGADEVIYNPASSAAGYAGLKDCFSDDNFAMARYDKMVDEIIKLKGSSSPAGKARIKSNPFYLESSKQFLRRNRKYHDFSCYSAGYDGPHINLDGEVYPCCAWTVSMGNISGGSFAKIWESKEAETIRKTIKLRKCPMCHHHTRTFDYIMRAPFLCRDFKQLIRGYRNILLRN